MTYRELREKLNVMSNKQLDCEVSIHILPRDEIYSITDFNYTDDMFDVLNPEDPVLVLDFGKQSNSSFFSRKRVQV